MLAAVQEDERTALSVIRANYMADRWLDAMLVDMQKNERTALSGLCTN